MEGIPAMDWKLQQMTFTAILIQSIRAEDCPLLPV